MRLSGTNVLVTGANRGIGRRFTEAAVARGARVYAAARRVETLAEVRARHGDRVVPVYLDLIDPASIERLPGCCPDIDVVVHNAAATAPGRPLAIPDGDVRALFEANVFGPLNLLRRLAPTLVERRGGVLLVSSISALLLSRSAPLYSASEAALNAAVIGLRAELHDAVQVSVVYPGFVDTDMTAGMEIAKATPESVAARALDEFEAGELAIFPDSYAEMVFEAIDQNLAEVLRDPYTVANSVVRRFAAAADVTRVTEVGLL